MSICPLQVQLHTLKAFRYVCYRFRFILSKHSICLTVGLLRTLPHAAKAFNAFTTGSKSHSKTFKAFTTLSASYFQDVQCVYYRTGALRLIVIAFSVDVAACRQCNKRRYNSIQYYRFSFILAKHSIHCYRFSFILEKHLIHY